MKKTTYLLLTFILIITLLSSNHVTYEATNINISKLNQNTERIDFNDGSYIIITLEADSSILINSSKSSLKSASKAAVGHHSSGKILWEFRIHAIFDIDYGRSAVATSSYYSHIINNKQWSFSDGWSSYSENMAEIKGVMKQKVMLIPLKTVDIHLTLTIDIYGNIT